MNKEVYLGLRPENIYSTDESKHLEDKSVVTVCVEVVEPMGNEVYLYATAGTQSLIARLDAHFKGKEGERIGLIFHMTRVHFFDVEREQIIAS